MWKISLLLFISASICKNFRILQNVTSEADGIVPTEQIFNITESGTPIDVTLNFRFSLNFIGNPTTGYSWFLIDDGIDSNALTSFGLIEDSSLKGFKATEYYQTSDSSLLGSGGVFTFKFLPKNITKDIELKFVYMRSWAPEEAPEYRTVKVRANAVKMALSSDARYYSSLRILVLIMLFNLLA